MMLLLLLMMMMLIVCCCRQLQVIDSFESVRLSRQRPLSSESTADTDCGSTPCNSQHLSTADNNMSLNADMSAVSDQKRSLTPPLSHTSATTEPLIVHAGAIVSMLHLLPSVACPQQPQVIDV